MKTAIPITENIYWVGANDKETNLFESLWPLPNGVSYNAYLIVDEKVTLVDTVKITYHDTYLDKIKNLLGDRKVDYLIINHMEPDHSGSIKALREAYPEVEIVGNKRTMDFLEGFYSITDGTRVVKEGDTLDLGEHKLQFYLTPMVHWPETMMTYEQTEKVLFSGDAFGGFGSLDGGVFDDEINIKYYEDEIRRYFANIVAKYSPMVVKAYEKVKDLDLQIIAATHGPVWRENPQYIIDEYVKWSTYQTKKGVVIVYGSMYGNTKVLAEEIARTLAEEGIKEVRLYDVSRTHLSYLISDIWNYKGLILGACTYNTEIFPPVAALTDALANRQIKNHILGIFGSYSWSSAAVKKLQAFNEKVKLPLIEPVIESKFSPTDEKLEKCRQLARNMAKEINS